MKLRLIAKNQEEPDVYSFVLQPDQPISWQPGQYLHYRFPHENADDRGLERYFTISAAPFEKHIMITTRFTTDHGSSFKKALQEAETGLVLEADGPKGEFLITDEAKHYILIAGGIGITPYRSQLLQLDHDNKDLKIDLLYLNRDENFVFDDLFNQLEQKHPSFHVHKYVDKKLTPEDLEPWVKEPDTLFYLSGPRPMVEAYQHMLADMGIPEDRVKTDYFPGY